MVFMVLVKKLCNSFVRYTTVGQRGGARFNHLPCCFIHSGLVEEGREKFDHVMKDDKIPLTTEHCPCLVDLLGRSGKVEDACEVVRSMPMKPSTYILSSLVSACKVHGRLEMAERLAHWLIKSEPDNAANHTMLSMVYAEADNWVGMGWKR
jgi:pentatricopeptide repeat protein